MKRTFALLATASLSTLCFADPVLVALGYEWAEIDGVEYLASEEDELPDPIWSVGGGLNELETVVTHEKSVGTGRGHGPTPSYYGQGYVRVGYDVWNLTQPGNPTVILVTKTYFAGLGTVSHIAGSKGWAKGINRFRAGCESYGVWDADFDDFDEERVAQIKIYPNDFSYNNITGTWQAHFALTTRKMLLHLAAEGHPTVFSAGAGDVLQTVYRPSAYLNPVTKKATGAAPSFVQELDIDVLSDTNVLLDQWSVDVTSSAFELEMFNYTADDYYFVFKHPKALNLKVPVTYGASVDVTGVDADAMLWGDLNGDNYISQAEVDFVYNSIGMDENDGFLWSLDMDASGFSPIDADIDDDGDVDSSDYTLVSGNVGLYGD